MKNIIFTIFGLLLLVPVSSYAVKDDLAYPVASVISTSKAQNADLLPTDFEPDNWDRTNQRSPKFMIFLAPETAAAIVQLQCDFWDSASLTNIAGTALIKEGNAISINTGFDFDFVLDYRDTNCNLQATSGGTQDWTVTVKKTYNSNR